MKLFDVSEIKPMFEWSLSIWNTSPVLDRFNLILFWINVLLFYASILIGLVLCGILQFIPGVICMISGIAITKIVFAIHGHKLFNRFVVQDIEQHVNVLGDSRTTHVVDVSNLETDIS